jgi:hypothetical protein
LEEIGMLDYEAYDVTVARVNRDVEALKRLARQDGTIGRHAMTALRRMGEDGMANDGAAMQAYQELEGMAFRENSPWNDESPLAGE